MQVKGVEEGRRPASVPVQLLERVGLQDKPRRLPGPALRRPAAAGGHRPGPGDGPQADAVRRADLGARPRARRRGAGGHARARRGRHDDDRRHARDGLRPRGRRPVVFMDGGVVVEQGRPARSSTTRSTSAPGPSCSGCAASTRRRRPRPRIALAARHRRAQSRPSAPGGWHPTGVAGRVWTVRRWRCVWTAPSTVRQNGGHDDAVRSVPAAAADLTVLPDHEIPTIVAGRARGRPAARAAAAGRCGRDNDTSPHYRSRLYANGLPTPTPRLARRREPGCRSHDQGGPAGQRTPSGCSPSAEQVCAWTRLSRARLHAPTVGGLHQARHRHLGKT